MKHEKCALLTRTLALLVLTVPGLLPLNAEIPADNEGADGAEKLVAAASTGSAAIAPAPESKTESPPAKRPRWEWVLADGPAKIKYNRKGLEVKSRGGNYQTKIRWRSQIRFSSAFDSDPRKTSHFAVPESRTRFRRARLKADGHAIRPWLSFKYEHDLIDGYLLDLRATFKKYKWLQFRAGQWKPEFSRERVTSSGSQQFAERSIVNREFTIDRQAGFQLMGHLMPETRGDSKYFLGVFTGNGRGGGFDSDGQPMLLARYQWNFLGEDPLFSSSDVEYHVTPAASLSLAGVCNRSRFTRFSSGGASQLDGFEAGAPGQYSIKQVMGEFFLKYRGLSVQNEVHWKSVYDNVNARRTNLRGSYIQAGYFPHGAMDWVPRQLELGYRYAFVDPRTALPEDLRQEHTFLVNWFFEGHSNKLTFDFGRHSLDRLGQPGLSDLRARVQWDVHF